jgi:hypothetical protein
MLPFEPDSVSSLKQTARLSSSPFIDGFSCLKAFLISHFRSFFRSIIHGGWRLVI